jgi:hypothetical protein
MLFLADGADDLGGDADDQRAVGDFHAGGDDGAGGNEAFFADVGVSEQDRAHSDQRAAADTLPVNDGAVADRDVVFDRVGKAGVAVDDRAVLDVDALADSDGSDVAADDGAKPDAGFSAEADVGGDGGVVGEVRAGGGFGEPVHKGQGSAGRGGREGGGHFGQLNRKRWGRREIGSGVE